MPSTSRTPNHELGKLLDQAGCQRQELARAINRVSVLTGCPLSLTGQAVSNWISGANRPKEQVKPLLLAALSEKCGRPIGHEEAGLTPPVPADGEQHVDVVDQLLHFGRAAIDPSRRGVLAAGVFSLAPAVPVFGSPYAHADEPVAPGKATPRVGAPQVLSVRRTTGRIADILDEDGAGHARPMAAAYLVNTVVPWLRAEATAQVGNDMKAAASDLVYLTGWMAMYEKDHVAAQRWYLKALDLADKARDHVTFCRTLRGMSLHMTSLRHGQKGLEFADSAAEAAPKAGPRLVAFLRGQQAHAASMVKDRRQAHIRLREAEQALSRADNRRDAVGGYDRTAWLFHVSHVLSEEKDLAGSIAALKESIQVQPVQERQGRVHSYALLAQRHLQLGHVDAACQSWGRFLDEYQQVSSARGDDHFHTMRKSMRPYRKAYAVRELAERAREVATLKA
ncbi:Transcriptional regulator OS=Streptomyces alboniger OX=132473 GN=CP975_15310 PE=4 SV=1 [Streptomyces alboniger]